MGFAGKLTGYSKMSRTQIAQRKSSKGPASCTKRSVARKRFFQAPSHVRRILMSSRVSKELKQKYKIRTIPLQREDEVQINSGSFKGREGKVVGCIRRKYVIHVDRITRDKTNGTSVPVPIHPSNCTVIKLRMDED